MSEPEKKDPHAAARAILAHYDENKDAKLSKEEISKIVEDYTQRKAAMPPEVLAALKTYDANADGSLDEKARQVYTVYNINILPRKREDVMPHFVVSLLLVCKHFVLLRFYRAC